MGASTARLSHLSKFRYFTPPEALQPPNADSAPNPRGTIPLTPRRYLTDNYAAGAGFWTVGGVWFLRVTQGAACGAWRGPNCAARGQGCLALWGQAWEFEIVARRIAGWLSFSLIAVASCTQPDQRQPGVPPGPPYRPLPGPAQPPPGHRPQAAVPPGEPGWTPPSGRISQRWTTVVVHHSATDRGSASAFDRGHRGKGWDELGYHFVIGNGRGSGDGQIEVGSRWYKQKHGAHCKTPDNYFNEHGIGVCLVGDFTRSRHTPRQLASLDRLLKFLCSRTGIPAERVASHGEVTHKTQCPGRNFPMPALRRGLADGAVGADDHWAGDGPVPGLAEVMPSATHLFAALPARRYPNP